MSEGRCPNGTLERPSCKRRNCPVCGPRWARDWQRNLTVNLEHHGGPVAMIAITGPGQDRLPWDEDWCRSRGLGERHKHSGKRGCRVETKALEDWCALLQWNWQRLRQAARLACKRELEHKIGEGNPAAVPAWVMARVWEPQKRGVPHLHLVVPYGTFDEKRSADCFRKHLARLATKYDFGAVQGKLAPIEGREAARYVANYLAGRSGKKSSIRENIADPRMPRSLLWLTPRLTRETLVNMRTVRRARHLWAHLEGRCAMPVFTTWEDGLRTSVAFRTIYPKRAGPLGEVDLAEALMHAKLTDEYEQRRKLRPLFYEEKKLADRALKIGRWAFKTTAPTAELAVAA